MTPEVSRLLKLVESHSAYVEARIEVVKAVAAIAVRKKDR